LLIPGRVLVKEGNLNVSIRSKKFSRFVYLFSDMAMFTKAIAKGDMCRPKETLLFSETTKVTASLANNSFQVTCGEENFTLEAESKPEADSWRLDFAKQVETVVSKSRNVFGVPLVEVIKKDPRKQDGIPHIVRLVVKEIEKDLDVKGIFRVPGNDDNVAHLKKILDTFEEVKNPFAKASAFDIAALLKSYIRELPEPLLTYELYDEFTSMEGTETDKTKLIETLKKLPKDNLCLVKFLMRHLINVAAHSANNLMTPNNLALIFGPGLLYPKIETIQYTLLLPRIFWIVQTMIEDYSAIFGEEAGSAVPVVKEVKEGKKKKHKKKTSRKTSRKKLECF